jgi:hypothetical protein
MLPHATLGVGFLTAALVGVWLRIGDDDSPFARLAVDVAVAGHLAWLAALLAAMLAVDYGPLAAVASTAAAIGTLLVAVALLRADDWPIAGLVAVAPAALLVTWAPSWVLFGLAWSAVGIVQLRGLSAGGATG